MQFFFKLKYIFICFCLNNWIQIYNAFCILQKNSTNIYMYLYFPKTCDPPIFVFVFGPDYCIHHMLFENHETFQEKKTIKLEIYTQMGSLTQTSALCELAPCIAILVRWQLELLCSSPDLNLHSGCVYWSPHSSTKVQCSARWTCNLETQVKFPVAATVVEQLF